MPERLRPILTEDQVAELLPQGRAFRFVGEVLELEPGIRIVARMIDLNRPEFAYLRDHFPEPNEQVTPGTITQEALEQAASLLVHSSSKDKMGVLTGVDGMRWRGFIKPTEEVLLNAEIMHLRSNAGRASVKATVEGIVKAEGQISFAFVDKSILAVLQIPRASG